LVECIPCTCRACCSNLSICSGQTFHFCKVCHPLKARYSSKLFTALRNQAFFPPKRERRSSISQNCRLPCLIAIYCGIAEKVELRPCEAISAMRSEDLSTRLGQGSFGPLSPRLGMLSGTDSPETIPRTLVLSIPCKTLSIDHHKSSLCRRRRSSYLGMFSRHQRIRNPDDGPSRMFHATKEEGKEWPLHLDSGPTAAGSAGGHP
jgi:hypothetical protein